MTAIQPLYDDDEVTQFSEVIPTSLLRLARTIGGYSRIVAARRIVALTGSVEPREVFSDDVTDAVFLRIQARSQSGCYDTEDAVARLGRGAKRLRGDGFITLYRAAPPGETVRPGDFAAGSPHEAGFYRHGGHKISSCRVRAKDVFAINGSCGGGQEYIYLPKGHKPVIVEEFFLSFAQFFSFARSLREKEMRESTEKTPASISSKPSDPHP